MSYGELRERGKLVGKITDLLIELVFSVTDKRQQAVGNHRAAEKLCDTNLKDGICPPWAL